MIKQVYFATRNPSTTHEEFLGNWKQHARLAGSFPSIVGRYAAVVQCRRTPQAAELPVDQVHDGANVLTYTDLLAAASTAEDPNMPTMLVDELRVFSAYVSESSLTAVEEVLRDGPVGQYLLLELATRAPDVSLPEFVSAWTGRFAPRYMASGAFANASRYVHNPVIFPTPPGYPYHGFAETWLESADAAEALIDASDEAYAALDTDAFSVGPRFLLQVNHAWAAH